MLSLRHLAMGITLLSGGCYLAGTDSRFDYGLTESSAPSHLQQKLNILVIGSSELSDVQALFGEPQTLRDNGLTWHVYWRPWATMTRQFADYPALGLSFELLTNPSRLYSVTVNTPDVALRSLRVGQSLDDVKRVMAGRKAGWSSRQDADYFLCDFEDDGIRFAFARDMAYPKFPMHLAQPRTIIKIERYDRTVEFFEGTSKEIPRFVNFRFFEPPPVYPQPRLDWYEEASAGK